MGVTNGFLRLSRSDFAALEHDASAFERRCRNYRGPDYLDMDKAGVELLLILDPAIAELDNSNAPVSPVPAIAQILGPRGTAIHREIDLGYGPAQRVSEEALRASVAEFQRLDYDACYAMATTELMDEMLMVEMDETMFREYHWLYLQKLGQFVREAVEREMVVLRY